MKKLFIIAAALFVTTGAHAASKGIGPAGCGLGNMLFGKDTQILAATTNGTSYSQMFGITSGTSNCVEGASAAKLDSFVEANKVALANDVARGGGETLVSISKILGCENQGALNSTLKSNYEVIFPTTEREASEVSGSILKVLKLQPEVANTCGHLG